MFRRDPLQIIAFKTSGTTKRICIRGRALQDENIDLDKKGVLGLLFNTWKRFETDEIRHATLIAKFPNGDQEELKTDRRGYFLVYKSLNNLETYTDAEGWLSVQLSYKDKPWKRKIQSQNVFYAKVLIPSEKACFGIISDVDDTIIHTGVASALKWRVLYNTFFKSAGGRLALNGAAEFYHLLHKGKTGKCANPIFYVSHSPWNLYRYIDYFLKKNNFPKGPIVLRNFPRPFKKRNAPRLPQKQQEILTLLNAHKTLNFILIGDSGEHDPYIYLDIVERYPERIMAIYIRNVAHKKKSKRVQKLFKNYNKVPVLLVENSAQAIQHAKANGFIA